MRWRERGKKKRGRRRWEVREIEGERDGGIQREVEGERDGWRGERECPS